MPNKSKVPLTETIYKRNIRIFSIVIAGALLATHVSFFSNNSRKSSATNSTGSLINNVSAQVGDSAPPTTTFTLDPNTPDGNNDWYVSPVTVDLSATDLSSGVSSMHYKINSGSWQTINFSGTSNQVTNPSFEISGSTSTGALYWDATIEDPEGTYTRDTTTYATGYSNASSKIVATGGTWHGINNLANFIAVDPYDNMSASLYMKTDNVTGSAYFNIYAISPNGSGGYNYTLLGSSSTLTGTNDWTNLSLDYTVNIATAEGIYIDVGVAGPGTIWVDAVSITTSVSSTNTQFIIASDNAAHQIEYYSEDFAGNVEYSSCVSPKVNCIEFKLDQTPPGNWSESGAVRAPGGGSNAEHELWVFTNVDDITSGLSTSYNEYQYHTAKEDGFGYFSNLLGCNSTWNEDGWASLEEGVLNEGDNTAFLKTQKTDFCDSNWKVCKDVRFVAEDMAGNFKAKDLCLNGPWIQVNGEGTVKTNSYIDMVSEADDSNSDGLIEIGGFSIDFFTSSKDWEVFNASDIDNYAYSDLYDLVVGTKTNVSNGKLVSSSGIYEFSGDLTLDNNDIPNNYDNNTFEQINFIDGNLTINSDIVIQDESVALFVVNGDVLIDDGVENVHAAIIAQDDIETAYNLTEGKTTKTLYLRGIYVADEIVLQRTLQGTQNNDTPAESFTFEPKYMIQLKQYFEGSSVQWTQ